MLSREGRKKSLLFALGGIPARVFNWQSEHHLSKTHPPKLVCELNFGCYEDCSGATDRRMSLQPVLKDRKEKTWHQVLILKNCILDIIFRLICDGTQFSY